MIERILKCAIILAAGIVLGWLLAEKAHGAEEDTPPALVEYINLTLGDSEQSQVVADLIMTAQRRLLEEFEIIGDPYRMATIYKYEAGFVIDSVSKNGKYYGLPQLRKKYHLPGMRKLGLNFYAEEDRLVYAGLLYSWHGDKPWSVRCKARKDYQRYFAD